MTVRLFDVQNGQVVPSEHCYTLKDLKYFMERYPDEHLKIYQYLFYMTCPDPKANPFFNLSQAEKEQAICEQIGVTFSPEDPDIEKGLKFCEKMYHTPTSRAHDAAKVMMDRITTYLLTSPIKDGRDGNGAFILKTMKDLKEMRVTYKAIYQDMMDEQKGRTRGDQETAYDQE
jgi:hypothetical protein